MEQEPFIQIHPGRETDNSRFFDKENLNMKVRYSTDDVFAAHAMVEAGLGYSLINEVWIKERFENFWGTEVAAVPLEPEVSVEIGIAIPPEERLSPAARRFVKFAEERGLPWEE